jgi:hypothetical protein
MPAASPRDPDIALRPPASTTGGSLGRCDAIVPTPGRSETSALCVQPDECSRAEAPTATRLAGLERLALHPVWATCDVENRASLRVLEKLGTRQEGRLRQNGRHRSEWRDSYLYTILGPQWRDATGRAP